MDFGISRVRRWQRCLHVGKMKPDGRTPLAFCLPQPKCIRTYMRLLFDDSVPKDGGRSQIP